jgi:hypothetical protein
MKPPPERHRIVDGVKTAYQVHETLEAIQSLVARFIQIDG